MEDLTSEMDKKIHELMTDTSVNKAINYSGSAQDIKKIQEEISKSERIYKIIFGFTATGMCLVLIETLFGLFATKPIQVKSRSEILLFALTGILELSYRYKIRTEKLRTTHYLMELAIKTKNQEQNKSK